MIASKFRFILISNLFLNVFCATKEFQIKFDVTCGNIPVTGIVQFCTYDKRELDRWQLNQETKLEQKGRYEAYEGFYYVYIRSDCGVLSRIGSYCQNEFSISFDARRQQKKVLLEYQPINLLNEIRKSETKTESTVLKCNEELKTFTCT